MDSVLKRKLEIGFSIFLLIVFLGFFYMNLGYPAKPREMPMIINIIAIICTSVHLINSIRVKAEPDKKIGAPVKWRAVFIAFGSMIAYIISSYFIGMVLSSPIIVFACGIAFGGKSRVKMGILSAIVMVAVYLIFVKGLGVYLFRGIFFGG